MLEARGLCKSFGNVVAVRADNSAPAPGSATAHVIPLQGDFFVHGGLYRGVSLVGVGDAHIALDDFGGPGVYARTTSVDAHEAVLEVRTRLSSRRGLPGATLRLRLLDDGGRTVASVERRLDLAVGRTGAVQALRVRAPRLWDGRRDPYRYRLVAELASDGRVLDRVGQAIGIRTFRMDPDAGFFLNGRHLPLHGVSRHQDVLGRDEAVTNWDQGQLKLAHLIAAVERLAAGRFVFGVDVCGDWSEPRFSDPFRAALAFFDHPPRLRPTAEDLAINARANAVLVDCFSRVLP